MTERKNIIIVIKKKKRKKSFLHAYIRIEYNEYGHSRCYVLFLGR